ncbi:EMB2654 [Symbiodinium necroappetens]|uniref:EMB2654 protein n=1 Tax=Symbiodinium necroappetens TaxID=1628268 RepID=A0A812RBU9_9DINO|nr:EMB2654 [Symbiodinium necroappetens]
MVPNGIQPDVITYNTALSMCSDDRWQGGIELLQDMKAAALQQDRFSFNTALNSCEKIASWRVARDLLKASGDLGVSSDTITVNSILNVCAGWSHWETASSALSQMQRRSLQADVISHSSALAACSGRWVQAGVLLGRVRHAYIRTNVLTLNTVINCLEGDPMSEPADKMAGWSWALDIFATMQLQRDVITYNSCITAARPSNRWQLANFLFRHALQNGLRPNVRTHNVVLATCAADGIWRIGICTLGHMHSDGVQPDVITQSSVHNALAQSLQWLHATCILLETPARQSNLVLYGAAVSSCSGEGRWRIAVTVTAAMLRRALLPNAVICNSLISACEKSCCWVQAIASMNIMSDSYVRGQLADFTITCNATISACEKSSQWLSVVSLLRRLRSRGLQATVTAENALMNACGSQERWKESLQALRRMHDCHMQPNLTTFNAVLNARERGRIWKDAVQLVAKLMEQRVVPGILTGCAAVAAAGRSTKWQLALAFLPRFQADLVAHSSAMNACLSAQRCQPVFVLLQELRDGSVKTDTVICNSVMAACVISRRPKQAASILYDVQCQGLELMASLS